MRSLELKNKSLLGTSQRELIVFYYYMGHLIQLSLFLGYVIVTNDFIKGHLLRSFIVPLNIQSEFFGCVAI